MAKLKKTKKKLTKRPAAKKKSLPKKSSEAVAIRKSESVSVYSAPYFEPRYPKQQELPSAYGKDKLVLQVRDTRWLHAYWELTGHTIDKFRRELKGQIHQAKAVLRVYDITLLDFNGSNANSFFDIQLSDGANNWYLDTNGPGRSWCVDLGWLLPDGRFLTMLRSNIVATPLDGPSGVLDEEWMIPDDMFARLYGMGFGLGKSSPVGKGWQERVKRQFLGASVVSSSPVRKQSKK